MLVPAPPRLDLPVFKLLTSVQFVPFQVSVLLLITPLSPPKAKAAVLDVPAAAKAFLAVFKSFTSVQLVPFQVLSMLNKVERFHQKLKLMCYLIRLLLKLLFQYLNH